MYLSYMYTKKLLRCEHHLEEHGRECLGMKYPTCWVINTGKPRIELFLVFYPKAIYPTFIFIGGTIRQACRSSTIAEKILIPGDNEACRYFSNGHGECFCTEDRCNTQEFLDDQKFY